jgi:hypothetical protein
VGAEVLAEGGVAAEAGLRGDHGHRSVSGEPLVQQLDPRPMLPTVGEESKVEQTL